MPSKRGKSLASSPILRQETRYWSLPTISTDWRELPLVRPQRGGGSWPDKGQARECGAAPLRSAAQVRPPGPETPRPQSPPLIPGTTAQQRRLPAWHPRNRSKWRHSARRAFPRALWPSRARRNSGPARRSCPSSAGRGRRAERRALSARDSAARPRDKTSRRRR